MAEAGSGRWLVVALGSGSGGRPVALPAARVRALARVPGLTRVPGAPLALAGLAGLRAGRSRFSTSPGCSTRRRRRPSRPGWWWRRPPARSGSWLPGSSDSWRIRARPRAWTCRRSSPPACPGGRRSGRAGASGRGRAAAAA
ncbi:hypothetical protein PUR29_10420 [Methylobacterium ajmalii]|uniref:Uncharacterized protein n=1 Tax=Methylobacterium ajmalii TaxID=2738439 RepID=A0ABU9ZSV8_9HYPH